MTLRLFDEHQHLRWRNLAMRMTSRQHPGRRMRVESSDGSMGESVAFFRNWPSSELRKTVKSRFLLLLRRYRSNQKTIFDLSPLRYCFRSSNCSRKLVAQMATHDGPQASSSRTQNHYLYFHHVEFSPTTGAVSTNHSRVSGALKVTEGRASVAVSRCYFHGTD